MGPQLFKIGKRKCLQCKQILDLNKNNFSPSSYKGRGGFAQYCKPCLKNHFAKLHENHGHGIPQREKIFNRLGKECNICGLENNLKGFFDIDHKIPHLKGKKHFKSAARRSKYYEIKNLQILCPNCHRIKTLQDAKYWQSNIWKKGNPKPRTQI